MNKINQKGFGAIEAVLITLVVIVLGFVGYRAYTVYTDSNNNDQALSTKREKKEKDTKEEETGAAEVALEGYRSEKYGFGLKNLPASSQPVYEYRAKGQIDSGQELTIKFEEVTITMFSENVSYGSDWDGLVYASKPFTVENGRYTFHPIDINNKQRIEVTPVSSSTNKSVYVKGKNLSCCHIPGDPVTISEFGVMNLNGDIYKSGFIAANENKKPDIKQYLKSFYQF